MRRLLLLTLPALGACPAGPMKETPVGDDTALDSGDTDTAETDTGESDTDDTHTGDTHTGHTDETDTGPLPTDADGDGYVPTAEGGDDCDDTNAAIHPGAQEYCDTVDQDCDGSPLAAGVCGQPAPGDASGVLVIRTSVSPMTTGIVGDLTGDGVPDLEGHTTDASTVYVIAGGALPSSPYRLEDGDTWNAVGADAVDSLYYVTDGGDMNGDGASDLLVGDRLDGGAAVRPGPMPGPGASASLSDEGSTWYASYIQTDLWRISLSGTDLDGDGRADFMAMNPSSGTFEQFPSDIHYQLYFGGEPDTRCDVRVDIDGGASWADRAAVIGDGDGDGFVEFAYFASGTTYMVSGADVRLLCDAYTEDVAGGSVAGDAAAGVHESLGDWDGDGYAEWPLIDENAATGETAIYLLSSAVAFGGEVDLAEAPSSYVTPTNRNFTHADALDFDGDGTKDLVLSENRGFQARVIRGGVLPGPNDSLPDRHLLFLYPADGVVGAYMPGGDLDGDGREDILAAHGWSDQDPLMNVRVILGFDVPWDDAKWWAE